MKHTDAICKSMKLNPDQAPWVVLRNVPEDELAVGEVFHIEGTPDDVQWQLVYLGDLPVAGDCAEYVPEEYRDETWSPS
jgi:hypothetical protein